MNIVMAQPSVTGVASLKGKTSLVTGSTSGIGIAINLSSAFHTTRLTLPAMVKNSWGRIINIGAFQVRLCRGEARHAGPYQDHGT
jgi:NAD(P)-dependent dehydrogenase (short-subunit alcohol dehydrogenase family)